MSDPISTASRPLATSEAFTCCADSTAAPPSAPAHPHAPNFAAQVEALGERDGLDIPFILNNTLRFDCRCYERHTNPCRRIDCRTCGPRRIVDYRTRLSLALKEADLRHFITLTSPKDILPTAHNAKRLRKAFLRLRQAYQRKHKHPMRGVWVFGLSHDNLHLHLATRDPSDVRWLKREWAKRIGAHQCDQRPIHDAPGLARYLIANYLQSANHHLGPRIGAFGGVKLNLAKSYRGPYTGPTAHDEAYQVRLINERLDLAGDRYEGAAGRQSTFPPFRRSLQAARRLLGALPAMHRILVMPWPALEPLRREILAQGRVLLVPNDDGTVVFEMRDAERPNSFNCSAYAGPVDLAVIGCLAFEEHQPRVYALDNEAQALIIENVQEPEVGLQIAAELPVVVLAADAQQVQHWPAYALSAARAHLAVTATREIALDPRCEVEASASVAPLAQQATGRACAFDAGAVRP